MARRRYVSTNVSIDGRLNRAAMDHGDFVALFYTWMIPHAGDDGMLRGEPDEILAQVLPLRRDLSGTHVREALEILADERYGLVTWDPAARVVAFPAEAFYRYQSYIKDGNRRGARNTLAANGGETRDPAASGAGLRDSAAFCADNGANQRKSAQNAVSFSSSFPVSSPPPVSQGVAPPDPALSAPGGDGPGAPAVPASPDPGDGGDEGDAPAIGRRVRPAPKPSTLTRAQLARFERWYAAYPKHEHRPEAEKAWAKLDPDDAMTDRLITDVAARKLGRKWAEGYIELPANYLARRVWEDDIEPERPPGGPSPRVGPNGRPSNQDNVAEAKRLLRQRGGPSPPAGVVVEAEYTVRRQ